jgi:hypothetical protein
MLAVKKKGTPIPPQLYAKQRQIKLNIIPIE